MDKLLFRFVVAIAALCALNAVLLMLTVRGLSKLTRVAPWSASKAAQKGDATCGATDPVSDPAYNMREIAKQSVLLEEHLVEGNKYCRDCIAKHFLHVIGLAEEAQMLACDRVASYPLLDTSAAWYRGRFETWIAHGKEKAFELAAELRERRKELIAAYILN